MQSAPEVVITGVGVVSPIGVGREAFWRSLVEGRTGVRKLEQFAGRGLPIEFGAEVVDFDPKQYITPRKSLKVMSRVIQLGVTAAELARQDAHLESSSVNPDRYGVVFGADTIYLEPEELTPAFTSCIVDGKFDFARWGERALPEMYPLWMLKYLPNMPACHIAIAQDARGPNNSIVLGEASSLLALAEAMRVIERGHADVMITGGTGSRIHPLSWVFRETREVSHRVEEPARASRPFDADRDGVVYGEGAGAFILESRAHAEARGATILARVLSYGSTFAPASSNGVAVGSAICASIERAISSSGLTPGDIGHVNAHGMSSVTHDRIEAQAIRKVLGEVPVTAPKSFFGNLGGGTGSVEMAATILGFQAGQIPRTLNLEKLDPDCPIDVVHGQPREIKKPVAVLLNQSTTGQAVAVVVAAEIA